MKGGLRRAFLLLMLVALSWQSYLLGTHVHAPAWPASISSGAAHSAPQVASRDRQLPDSPDTCPICRELAQAGHYLTPAPIVFDAPILTAARLSEVAAPAPALVRQRSHAWRSRAPPTLSRT